MARKAHEEEAGHHPQRPRLSFPRCDDKVQLLARGSGIEEIEQCHICRLLCYTQTEAESATKSRHHDLHF